MSREYISVATSKTIYFEPQCKEEIEQMATIMKVGDIATSAKGVVS